MIYEVEGDILMNRAKVIAQGVTAKASMNKWTRQNLQERFLSMRHAFDEWCE